MLLRVLFGSSFGGGSRRLAVETALALVGEDRFDDPDRLSRRALRRRNLARALAFNPDVISDHELMAVLDAESAEGRGRMSAKRGAEARGEEIAHDDAWLPGRQPVAGGV